MVIKTCKYCNITKEYSNWRQFAAHVTNCKINQNYKLRNQKISKLNTKKRFQLDLKCKKCNTSYTLMLTASRIKKEKYKKHCSLKCANSKVITKKHKAMISIKLKGKCGHKKTTSAINKQKITARITHLKKKKIFIENNSFEKWPTHYRREFLYAKHNNSCEECGYTYINPKNGKGPFDMHHIDGNRLNNKEDNIKFLCRNCHWKTDNFAGNKRKLKKK